VTPVPHWERNRTHAITPKSKAFLSAGFCFIALCCIAQALLMDRKPLTRHLALWIMRAKLSARLADSETSHADAPHDTSAEAEGLLCLSKAALLLLIRPAIRHVIDGLHECARSTHYCSEL